MQEVETYFSEGLTKWRDLNLTENFSVYKHRMVCFITPVYFYEIKLDTGEMMCW